MRQGPIWTLRSTMPETIHLEKSPTGTLAILSGAGGLSAWGLSVRSRGNPSNAAQKGRHAPLHRRQRFAAQAVGLCDELRQRIRSRLDLAPVVVGCPVTRECLHHRKRRTL